MKKIICFIVALCLALAAFGQVTEKREVSAFTGIDASSMFKIYLKKGNTESLTITAEEELMPHIESRVKNGVLHLYIKDPVNFFRKIESPKIELVMKDLTNVDLSGVCLLQSEDTFEPAYFNVKTSGASQLYLKIKTGNMDIEMTGASKVELDARAKKALFDISGASKLTLDLDVEEIALDISGASNISLTGKATTGSFDISGASKVGAFEFTTKKATVELSGTSKMEVNASEELTIDISGMSSVSYKGNPVLRSVESSGMSKIKQIK